MPSIQCPATDKLPAFSILGHRCCCSCYSSGFVHLMEAENVVHCAPRGPGDWTKRIRILLQLVELGRGKQVKAIIAEITMNYLVEHCSQYVRRYDRFRRVVLKKADELTREKGVDEPFIQTMVNTIKTFESSS